MKLDDSIQARRIAHQRLRSFQNSGMTGLPKPTASHRFEFVDQTGAESGVDASDAAAGGSTEGLRRAVKGPSVAGPPTKKPERTVDPAGQHYVSQPLGLHDRANQLAILAAEVANCTKCPELAACRQNTVFGIGNPQPQLCFLGEGPGADEDRQGEPFVGAAGQLLDRIIEACQLSRSEVYILNTVKCRPPRNRNPNESELENCWPYAIAQLEILQPEFICCLGSVAAKTLLQTGESIGRMRGRFFNYRDSRVAVTYHPAYLLRNPSAKRQVWDDMKMLMLAMGRQV